MITKILQAIRSTLQGRFNKASVKAPCQVRGQRVIIIHNHIFKNAGSSIDWALRNNFGRAFVDHRDDKKMLQGPSYLGPYLQNNPELIALSTHHLRPPLPRPENTRILTIMMFRHPLERVTSVYNFERSQSGAGTYGARFARKHSLREYVLWRMRPDVPPTIRNFHIFRSLPAPVSWRRQLTQEDLAKAKEFVESVDLLGFVDSFDLSMVLFEQRLRPFFPDIDLSYRMQNVGQDLDETRQQRLERLRREIGEKAFDLLMEQNNMDLRLYGLAREIFEKRVSRISDAGLKLGEFRDRCRKHGGYFNNS